MAWTSRPLAAVGRLGHGLGCPMEGFCMTPTEGGLRVTRPTGRLLCDTAMEGFRVTPWRPFGVEDRWMAAMCGSGSFLPPEPICEGRSYSGIPTFLRGLATSAAMLEAAGLTVAANGGSVAWFWRISNA